MFKNINKKGVTLVILAVTIIVALILLSTIIVSYDKIKVSMNKRSFAQEIYTIQKLCDEYRFKNNSFPTVSESPYFFVEAKAKAPEQFSSEEDNEELYEIDLAKIGVENVSRGIKDSDNDVYVISKKTNIVYYLEGFEVRDEIYYTLTEELNNLLK